MKKNATVDFVSLLFEDDEKESILDNFVYRKHQVELNERWNSTDDYIAICWGRRGGKDYIVMKNVIEQCKNNVNTRVAYFFPTIKQGVAAIFEGITLEGQSWLETLIDRDDVISPKSNGRLYHSDNTIRFKNGSIIRILGADTGDTKVGTNEHVVVFSEASHMPKFKSLLNRMIPSISQIGGRIVVISTPNYGSDFNKMMKKETQGWYKSIVRADEMYNEDGTRVYEEKELKRNRDNMSESEYEQEYMCSLDATNFLSIYGKSFNKATQLITFGKMTPQLFVSFDLGIADYTVLTFARYMNGVLTVIHHLGVSGEGSKFYSDYITEYCLKNKINKNGVTLLLPFDSMNRQRGFDRNTTTFNQLKNVGWNCILVPRCGQKDGINITRRAIEHNDIAFYNNDSNMKIYIEKVKSYEYKVNTDGSNTYLPNHGTAGDAPSNYADSLEYMCIYFFGQRYKDSMFKDFKPKVNNTKNPFCD